MTATQFIHHHQPRTGDRIIVQKGPMIWHHAIFVQLPDGKSAVAENRPQSGVQFTDLDTFLARTGQTPSKVERFVGTKAECRQIIPRINALLGTNYDLLRFNCEHLANVAQGKQPVSRQVGGWLLGVTVLGLYFAFRSRND